MNFEEAFVTELDKLALAMKPTYPISRFVTHPAGGAVVNALLSLPGAAASPGQAIGGALSGAGSTAADRWLHSRGMLGRVRKGGGALFGHEKRRLAEATGLSMSGLESSLEKLKASSKGKPTYPISRFLTHWAQIGPVLSRLFHGRSVAGRAAKGGSGLWKGEREALDELKGHAPILSSIRAAMKN